MPRPIRASRPRCRPIRRRPSRPRSNKELRRTSSCRPTRRTRRSSSTRGWQAASLVPFADEPADRDRPHGQPRQDPVARRPGAARREGDRGGRLRADHQVREATRHEPRETARTTRPTTSAAYTANIASKEDNVGAVVAKVGLGEGDAAIVYQTDAKTSPKVTAIPVPAGANVAATYAGVVVKAPTESGGGGGIPGVACRAGGSVDPDRGRLPAGRLTTALTHDGAPAKPGARRPHPSAHPVPRGPGRRTRGAGVSRRRPHRGAGQPGRPRRPAAEPRHDRDQPRPDPRPSGPRSRTCSPAGRSEAHRSSRRPSTFRSSCRRRSPVSRCSSCSAAKGCSVARWRPSASSSRSPRSPWSSPRRSWRRRSSFGRRGRDRRRRPRHGGCGPGRRRL